MPVLWARGPRPGPTLGILAAVHGNELNGVAVIHRLFQSLDPRALSGTLVGVPIANPQGFLGRRRTLSDGQDLNRMMPGRERGGEGEQLAFRLRTQLIEKLDALLDLHTAGYGRVNSVYVRADLSWPAVRKMAGWPRPEIIVHAEAPSGSVRGAAEAVGIPALTIEIGAPQRFQREPVQRALDGVGRVLGGLGIVTSTERPDEDPRSFVCGRAGWMIAQHGGLLDVPPDVGEIVDRGRVLARVSNLFGDVVAEYAAPERAIVVGKSTDPVCASGARMVHLGFETDLDDIPLRADAE